MNFFLNKLKFEDDAEKNLEPESHLNAQKQMSLAQVEKEKKERKKKILNTMEALKHKVTD